MSKSRQPQRHTDAQSRRRFLRDSSLMVAGGLSLSRAAHVSGGEPMRVGLVGCGRQGTRLTRQLLEADPDVNLYAMADVFRDRLQACYRGLNSRCGNRCQVSRERQFVGQDACAELVKTDLDLVVLAATPSFLPSHFEEAVHAGLHIFVEPPLAANAAGVQQILAADYVARQLGLCVDVGFQKRHDLRYRETAERVFNGQLGELTGGELRWIGSSPQPTQRKRRQSEFEYRLRNWRLHEGLGGHPLLEKQIHSLDVVNWILGSSPQSARRLELPKQSCAGQFASHVEFTYPDGLAVSCLTDTKSTPGTQFSEWLHGDLGSAQLDAGLIRDRHGKTVWRSRQRSGHQSVQLSTWLDNIRQGRAQNSLQAGLASTLTALLARSVCQGPPTQKLQELLA